MPSICKSSLHSHGERSLRQRDKIRPCSKLPDVRSSSSTMTQMSLKLLRCLLAVIVGAAGILAAQAFAAMWIYPVPMNYFVLAEFRELPADDKKLEEWLLSQPGVYIGF